MPWSISSKMRLGISSARASTFLSPSMRREVSPPEAMRASGLSPSPGLGATRNSTRSSPFWSKATRVPSASGTPFGSGRVWKSTPKRAAAIFRSSSSVSMPRLNVSAACLRLSDNLPACEASLSSRLDSCAASASMRSVAVVMVSSCARASAPNLSTASMLPPYLRVNWKMRLSRSSTSSNRFGLNSISSR